jgi:hypothetical protein
MSGEIQKGNAGMIRIAPFSGRHLGVDVFEYDLIRLRRSSKAALAHTV